MELISIKDNAPNDGDNVICTDGKRFVIAQFEKAVFGNKSMGDKFKIHRDAVLGERVYVTYIPNVTHWAPLPKLPLPLVDIQSNIDDSFSADIRDEMDTDMSEGGMPQG